jgi:hypothetical protein
MSFMLNVVMLSVVMLNVVMLLRSGAFHSETKFSFFYKAIYLNDEVNSTDPFPTERVPWPCES